MEGIEVPLVPLVPLSHFSEFSYSWRGQFQVSFASFFIYSVLLQMCYVSLISTLGLF